ncbi:hypothetical protein SLEP1_g44895 [Rubroshorea leprosula]|uniref:Protein IQ-DOMAIN 1 n=1 Tax=Rubroshorea leprosula TaxID=152421 RepID=A0AAV5LHI6_9ROSI|nr:hypothetical protein SLEP1_g44895 [Rubroshorea leprosula]
MGSQNLFKTIISLKREKGRNVKQVKGSSASAKSNGFKWKNRPQKLSTSSANGSTGGNSSTLGVPIEDLAAIRIQTAFRAYKARKSLRRLKGMARLQTMVQTYSIKKQATSTLSHLHSWSNVQSQIRARRLSMVTEGQLRQKKMENQLKLEAKLHDLEVEWSDGPETKEEILTRIHQRENAAVKRERAMAYAFSHQWRANSNYNGLNNYELAKANWGWSWVERWIAARPWESRVSMTSISPKKVNSKQASKVTKNSSPPSGKAPALVKESLSIGKGTARAGKLSFPDTEKPGVQESTKDEEMNNKKEKEADNMV